MLETLHFEDERTGNQPCNNHQNCNDHVEKREEGVLLGGSIVILSRIRLYINNRGVYAEKSKKGVEKKGRSQRFRNEAIEGIDLPSDVVGEYSKQHERQADEVPEVDPIGRFANQVVQVLGLELSVFEAQEPILGRLSQILLCLVADFDLILYRVVLLVQPIPTKPTDAHTQQHHSALSRLSPLLEICTRGGGERREKRASELLAC